MTVPSSGRDAIQAEKHNMTGKCRLRLLASLQEAAYWMSSAYRRTSDPIELWGDEVIRSVLLTWRPRDPSSNLEEVSICPAVEFPQEGRRASPFWTISEETILFLDEPVRLIEKGQEWKKSFWKPRKRGWKSGHEVTDAKCKCNIRKRS